MNDFEDILDLLVRHRIFLTRLSAEQGVRIGVILNRNNRDHVAMIREQLEDLVEMNKFTSQQVNALGKLESDLADALDTDYADAQAWYVKELDELVTHEIAASEKIVKSALTLDLAKTTSLPTQTALNRLTATTPYNGYPIGNWFKGMESSEINQVMARVRSGIANGDTIQDMIRGIRGTRESGYTDGIMKGYTTRQAETLARTVTNGVSNAAQQEYYKANESLISHEVYTATLDGRTSTICASLDGTRHKVGEGPVPPLHPNCRSVRVPVTKSMAEEGLIGDRPYVRDADTRRERNIRFRAEAHKEAGDEKWKAMSVRQRDSAIRKQRIEWSKANVGQVSAKTSYETWLNRQPAWFQKEVLGKTRYELFSKGDLKLSSFIDHNNQRYTLEQLRKIEGAAFEKAGIGA